jgi:thiosulfate dehydrogenase [quinone] large subunit
MLFPVQFFLGLGWIRAGVEKLVAAGWWHGSALRAFLDAHSHSAIAFMPAVASAVFEPLAVPISLLVMCTQPLIGLSLITGRVLRPALAWGITLNLVFVLMGEVSPSVFYLMIELALLTAVDLGAIGRSPRGPSPAAALLWAAAALAAVPFVGTLAPSEVIRDPGIILVTVATIAAATQALRLLASTFPSAALDSPRMPAMAGRAAEEERSATP